MNEKVSIILNSRYKNVQYQMFSDKILVKSKDKETCIELPRIDRAAAFWDMYYVNGCINVIIATRGSYDIRYVLDEDNFELVHKQFVR